ncbi:MAG TPA: acetylxylan esterase, partial [Candidatus Sulfopaludibacter sp.]|nr:acetylxylan esterase [Candidatus Sulfopaludibacter sp.]
MRWIVLCAACLAAAAQPRPETNYDEAKVPAYSLPDVLRLNDGEHVFDARTWTNERRPQILEMYRTDMFGKSPPAPANLNYEVASVDKHALDGKAVRKLVTLSFSGKPGTPRMNVLLYLPAAAKKPSPVFVAVGFSGNQTVAADPGVPLADEWVMDRVTRQYIERKATEDSRGRLAQQWQVDQILAHGYGLATVYCGDIEPDFDGGLPHGIRPLFYKPGQTAPAGDEWGAIGAWAWGLSRIADYLEKDRDVDAKHIAVFGHSRMGKTAIWAGAQDTRFSLVISNESGEGGAAIARRDYGERTAD